LPMLVKAHRTRDLASYSLGNVVLANVGNAVYSVYVFSLPMGPIWALHGFYLTTSAQMLIWCLRYGRPTQTSRGTRVERFVDGRNQKNTAHRLAVSESSRDTRTYEEHKRATGLISP